MRVRVKAAHNYATNVKMREFRLRSCNRPRIVATASVVDSAANLYTCAQLMVAVELRCASDRYATRTLLAQSTFD